MSHPRPVLRGSDRHAWRYAIQGNGGVVLQGSGWYCFTCSYKRSVVARLRANGFEYRCRLLREVHVGNTAPYYRADA